jgi:cyclophilin family peptidyl-prolyl cis-trans isomerase
MAILVLGAVTGMLVGCGADSEKRAGTSKTATQRPQTTKSRTGTRSRVPGGGGGPTRCLAVKAPPPKPDAHLPKPTLRLDPSRTYRAVFDTSCGRFTVTLDVKRAPKTTASFVHMVRKGLYDNTTIHRVVPGFVIQGGDPQGTGRGGPGYSVVEAPPSDLRYTRGIVAMAKSEIEDPGTSGSQFYVVLASDAQLPADYALLGEVSQNFAAVQRIGAVPTDETNPDPALRERPKRPVVVRAVTVTEGSG